MSDDRLSTRIINGGPYAEGSTNPLAEGVTAADLNELRDELVAGRFAVWDFREMLTKIEDKFPNACGWCGELVLPRNAAAHPCNGTRSTCYHCGDGMFLDSEMVDGLCQSCADTPEEERRMVGP